MNSSNLSGDSPLAGAHRCLAVGRWGEAWDRLETVASTGPEADRMLAHAWRRLDSAVIGFDADGMERLSGRDARAWTSSPGATGDLHGALQSSWRARSTGRLKLAIRALDAAGAPIGVWTVSAAGTPTLRFELPGAEGPLDLYGEIDDVAPGDRLAIGPVSGPAARVAFDAAYVRVGSFEGHTPAAALRCRPTTRRPRAPRVLVGVKTFDRLSYLRQCLHSLASTLCPGFDVIVAVADDGSSDGTLEYLDSHRLPVELRVIRNRRRFVSGQFNSLVELGLTEGVDFFVMVDDDVVFKRAGWLSAYFEAAMSSGLHHLCHFNLPHYRQLCERRGEAFPPPAHAHPRHPLIAHVPVDRCMGALFTLTPEVVRRVGWADEVNFYARGLWHVDYSMRCARAGFNDADHFYDICDSNEFVELQNTRGGDYVTSISWASEVFKRATASCETERRRRVISIDDRVHVSRQQATAGPLLFAAAN